MPTVCFPCTPDDPSNSCAVLFWQKTQAGGKVITWIFWSRLRRSEAPISQGGNLQGQTINVTVVYMFCFVFFLFSDADQSQIAVIKRDLFRVGYIASTQNLMRYQKVSAVGVTGQENEKPSRIRLHTQSFKQTTAAVGDGVGMLTIN